MANVDTATASSRLDDLPGAVGFSSSCFSLFDESACGSLSGVSATCVAPD